MIEIGFSYLLSKFNTKEPSNLEECIKESLEENYIKCFLKVILIKFGEGYQKQISA